MQTRTPYLLDRLRREQPWTIAPELEHAELLEVLRSLLAEPSPPWAAIRAIGEPFDAMLDRRFGWIRRIRNLPADLTGRYAPISRRTSSDALSPRR